MHDTRLGRARPAVHWHINGASLRYTCRTMRASAYQYVRTKHATKANSTKLAKSPQCALWVSGPKILSAAGCGLYTPLISTLPCEWGSLAAWQLMPRSGGAGLGGKTQSDGLYNFQLAWWSLAPVLFDGDGPLSQEEGMFQRGASMAYHTVFAGRPGPPQHT